MLVVLKYPPRRCRSGCGCQWLVAIRRRSQRRHHQHRHHQHRQARRCHQVAAGWASTRKYRQQNLQPLPGHPHQQVLSQLTNSTMPRLRHRQCFRRWYVFHARCQVIFHLYLDVSLRRQFLCKWLQQYAPSRFSASYREGSDSKQLISHRFRFVAFCHKRYADVCETH